MLLELEEFYQEFFQDIHRIADANGLYVEDAFFEEFCSHLVDAGELETADRAQYIAPRGLRVDGYGGDPADAEGVLTLIIADLNQSTEISTLTATELDAIFSRLNRFLTKALDDEFRSSLEESSAAFGLADLISARWPLVGKVRFILITNRVLSSRVDGRPAGELEHATITYSVWDIERLYRYVIAGGGRDAIDIDLVEEFGGTLSGLPAHLEGADYEAYLVVVPGLQLAAIYDRWGARLLEQNVRCFLQAKGSVNKGIRITIENDPQMFFAYNNGITATAESVDCIRSNGGIQLTRLRNLQIVNGGQTTASIHAASRKKGIDLSKVFVQMKLSIIPPARSIDVVPKISEYANSQNRVNAADFFANHPFHIRFEEFSRRIFAPSPDGTFKQTKWFYERARGQYQDARAYLTTAQKKAFDLEYPKTQLIEKTELAKYLNVWRQVPDVVSKGAQKNFGNFATLVGQEWAKQPDAFNELFYRESIAKAIVFRAAEKLVSQQPWYDGGFRAQVVAYAISKLAYEFQHRGRSIDFEQIWKKQAVSQPIQDALIVTATAANTVLTDPPAGISNVTEWAKKPGCWEKLKDMKVTLPSEVKSAAISYGQVQERKKSAVKEQKLLTSIEAQIEVANRGAHFWKQVRAWGLGRKLLTEKEIGVLDVAASMPNKLPTERQCEIIMAALYKLQSDGCQLGLNDNQGA